MSRVFAAERQLSRKLIPAAVGLAFAGAATPATADPSEQAQRADAVTLDKVTVEGRAEAGYGAEVLDSPKFTAPIMDTPKSVTVIPQTLIQDTMSTSLQDTLRLVPGITLLAGEGGQALADRPVIRGLNATSTIFVDGVRDIGTQTREVFDVESVEVIKGADSVYSGRGGGGGSVNLVSKTAHGRDFTQASLMGGSADTLRGTIDQNWAVTDSVGVRLTAMGAKGDQPGRDDAVDYEKWGFSPSLAFGIGKPTRVTLDYYHHEEQGMPDYSMPYDLSTGLPATETLGVDAENFYGLNHRDFRDAETDIGTLELAHDFGFNATARNVTRLGESLNSYVVTNPDDSRGNVAEGYVYRSTKQRWAETETLANVTDLTGAFETGRVLHRYSMGVEFSREKVKRDGWSVTSAAAAFGSDCTSTELDPGSGLTYGELLLQNGDCTSLFDPDPSALWRGTVTRNNTPTYYETQATAVYAFDTITLTRRWIVNLGLRAEHYDTEAETPSDPAANASHEDHFLNHQAGVVFKPTEDGSIYASYATGSTPSPLGSGDEDLPAVGGRSGPNVGFEPEETATIEFGAKWQLFERRLQLSAAVFETTRENANIQVQPDVFEQVGETEVRGFELGFTGAITPQWQLFGGYSYLDSELVRGAYDDAAVGEQLPNVPEHAFTMFTSYDVTPKLRVGGGAFYTDEVYGRTAPLESRNLPVLKVPDYWRFDAMAAWAVSPELSVQLNVNNLTDETYYAKAYGAHYAALGPGRQVLVSANLSF